MGGSLDCTGVPERESNLHRVIAACLVNGAILPNGVPVMRLCFRVKAKSPGSSGLLFVCSNGSLMDNRVTAAVDSGEGQFASRDIREMSRVSSGALGVSTECYGPPWISLSAPISKITCEKGKLTGRRRSMWVGVFRIQQSYFFLTITSSLGGGKGIEFSALRDA